MPEVEQKESESLIEASQENELDEKDNIEKTSEEEKTE